MYLLIPFLLILASASAVFFIVWRKRPALEKLAGSEDATKQFNIRKDWHSVVHDLCPEVIDWAKNIKVEEYKELWLVELEKLLRRLRVVSLKMDRFSDSLIKKIRKNVYSGSTQIYVETKEGNNEKSKPDAPVQEDGREELKKTEQKLIMEIAKNPKSSVLYEELGDLYLKMENPRDAKESYEAAIELSPQNEFLKQKLSSALEKLNPQK